MVQREPGWWRHGSYQDTRRESNGWTGRQKAESMKACIPRKFSLNLWFHLQLRLAWTTENRITVCVLEEERSLSWSKKSRDGEHYITPTHFGTIGWVWSCSLKSTRKARTWRRKLMYRRRGRCFISPHIYLIWLDLKNSGWHTGWGEAMHATL